MKIEDGKYYRTRDGHKIGPMTQYGALDCDLWGGFPYSTIWTGIGRPVEGTDKWLIAPWTGEPAAPKTWGEMTDAEKGTLLLAHHEGAIIQAAGITTGFWQNLSVPKFQDDVAYRVRPPEPVHMIEEIIINNLDGIEIGSGTVETINGTPVWNSLKVVERINDYS